ncbi:DegV family protein [Phytoactinopolyspora mesophila]|uniref:DegV family EDD domain-containing protein n=1 Tax=Phytoactinopolyspora mesophila TaxID=2650750 RepID=A0A7K3M085_9ACTN|nr:DegV family protein [Phytoactinopolyspora mesophila]NDL56706.1 DegV family EDD domain-containing protein [Phytoactinopolyspora mesophila]
MERRTGQSGSSSPGRVAVVTDSTAYLAPDLAAEFGVHVVPLHVVIDGVPRVEGAGIGPQEVAAALRGHAKVSTSRPTPQALLDTYRQVAEQGADHIVSVHLSGGLSGTVDAARLAAEEATVPVEVVDSESIGMGLGFAVLAAAAAARRGSSSHDVVAAATATTRRSSAFFYVDTLEYLRRGGRIGPASAMLGTALAIKPLLYLDGGLIKPLEKVRTAAKAVARLEDLAVERAGTAEVNIAVHHLDNAARAEALASRLSGRLTAIDDLVVSEVGAVIGAHTGPGMLAVVVSPVGHRLPYPR